MPLSLSNTLCPPLQGEAFQVKCFFFLHILLILLVAFLCNILNEFVSDAQTIQPNQQQELKEKVTIIFSLRKKWH